VLTKILIANRGEIACRVLRTCKRLGIATVAVYSDADAEAPHVKLADEAVRVGPPPVKDSYLNVEAIVGAALSTGARGVHPGYGLLSENAGFAARVAAAGVTFIGPPVPVLEAFGDKIKARHVARAAGVSPPPGTDGPIAPDDAEAVAQAAERIGYPVLVKAAGGGGGIGMQVVDDPAKLARAVTACSDRGRSAFADARVYLERYVRAPRHIEVQVLCDAHGGAVALGERECSVQRRHQKIVEETPSPAAFFAGDAGEQRRRELLTAALRVVTSVGYVGAGTVEFVASPEGELFFLEAEGGRLPDAVLHATRRGHAVEVRVYAEDPAKKFVPQPGKLERVTWPAAGDDLRVETGVTEGMTVTPYYDPLLAKIVAHGADRAAAIARLDRALADTTIDLVAPTGAKAATNLAFLRKVLGAPPFTEGRYDTSFAEALAKG
jgi:acetyl-CoA carboxylase biotin carboxylase subunit/3-methylcrotonyl-CoA carboxylase alpha subunit